MNRYERKQPRTAIHDLDPRRAIRPLADHELRLATGGHCFPMTTNIDGAGASDDVGRL